MLKPHWCQFLKVSKSIQRIEKCSGTFECLNAILTPYFNFYDMIDRATIASFQLSYEENTMRGSRIAPFPKRTSATLNFFFWHFVQSNFSQLNFSEFNHINRFVSGRSRLSGHKDTLNKIQWSNTIHWKRAKWENGRTISARQSSD